MSEPFVFDPRCDLCKEPFGAAVCGTAVTFHCRPLASEHFSHCALVAVCEFSGTRQELELSLELKRHFMELVEGYDNVKVYDFQGADFTADLDNYMDMSHYSPEINDFMVSCFASGDYLTDSSTLAETERQIRDNIDTLLFRYPEIEEIEK